VKAAGRLAGDGCAWLWRPRKQTGFAGTMTVWEIAARSKGRVFRSDFVLRSRQSAVFSEAVQTTARW
jgi:hypothetical protein